MPGSKTLLLVPFPASNSNAKISQTYFYLCAQELETGTSLWFWREFRGIATSGCIDWRGDVEGSGLSYLLTCKRSVGHIVG